MAGHPAPAAHPTTRYRGHPRVDDRACLAGIVDQLPTGIPGGCCPHATRLRQPGHLLATAARLATRPRLAAAADQLGRQGRLDWSSARRDSISARAKPGAG